jgi:hypothetical protein
MVCSQTRIERCTEHTTLEPPLGNVALPVLRGRSTRYCAVPITLANPSLSLCAQTFHDSYDLPTTSQWIAHGVRKILRKAFVERLGGQLRLEYEELCAQLVKIAQGRARRVIR